MPSNVPYAYCGRLCQCNWPPQSVPGLSLDVLADNIRLREALKRVMTALEANVTLDERNAALMQARDALLE